jgi:hypothetical protein
MQNNLPDEVRAADQNQLGTDSDRNYAEEPKSIWLFGRVGGNSVSWL